MWTVPPERGFTLIELLVAITIFAALALTGWQVMDNLSKARDRAKQQADRLSDLQYAYGQMAQDFSQAVGVVVVPAQATADSLPNTASTTAATQIDINQITPSFVLANNQVEFVRHVPPDPRYANAPTLARVGYGTQDDTLLRARSYELGSFELNQASRGIVLHDVKDVTWAVFTPEKTNSYPIAQFAESTNTADPIASLRTLPKAVEVSFNYADEPIVWRFSIPNAAPIVTKP